jgi:hypothetical protein
LCRSLLPSVQICVSSVAAPSWFRIGWGCAFRRPRPAVRRNLGSRTKQTYTSGVEMEAACWQVRRRRADPFSDSLLKPPSRNTSVAFSNPLAPQLASGAIHRKFKQINSLSLTILQAEPAALPLNLKPETPGPLHGSRWAETPTRSASEARPGKQTGSRQPISLTLYPLNSPCSHSVVS